MADTFKGNRHRPWGRWLLLVAATGLIALVPAYFLWTRSLERQLDDQVAALRAAGEPILLADLTAPTIPPEQNTVIHLRRAASTLSPPNPPGGGTWQQLANNDFNLPMTDEAAAQVRAAVDENSSVLDDVAQATTKPAVDWQITFTSPGISILLPDLNYQRSLAMFLKAAALDAHLRGDDAAAVTRIRHTLYQAKAVGRHPMLIGYMVAAGIGSIACNASEQIAPDLRIGGSGASPQQVRALIDDLLDESAMRAAFRSGLVGERVSQLDVVRCLNSGTIPYRTIAASTGTSGAILPLALKPLVLRDGLFMLQHTTGVLAASDAPDLPAFVARCPPMPPWMTGGGGFGHPVAKPMLPAFQNSGQSLYRALAERRLAATLLAIRWYEVEHGKRPATLEPLVPRYLPAVPLDPLATAGRAIRYAADGETPSVYSVGADGRDNNGNAGANRWQGPDLVIPLDRPTPTTQPPDATMPY
jgi:hypothetical protein